MKWVTHYDGTDWKVESNGILTEEALFYRWEKSFVKITMKTLGAKNIDFENEDYQFFNQNDEVIIEVSDLVRAYAGGTFELLGGSIGIDWIAVKGERLTEFNKIKIPSFILFDPSIDLPFYVELAYNYTAYDKVTGLPIDLNIYPDTYDRIGTIDWNSLNDTYKPTINMEESSLDSTSFISSNCWSDKVLLEWESRFGGMKSWWFEVDRMTYGSDKVLNLQTLDNGYSTMKNKRLSVRIKQTRADNITQHYLSDITISDEVYMYDGADKIQVRVADSAFDVTKGKRDISLTINKYAYDTI